MRSLIQTIVVLTALNLARGSSAPVAEVPAEEPQQAVGQTSPPVPEPIIPEPPMPVQTLRSPKHPVTPEPTSAGFSSTGRLGTASAFILGRGTARRVIVVPTTETTEQELFAVWEDMYVMAHIFDKSDERLRELHQIGGVFADFGNFLGADTRPTEAIYLQGYGVVFLMEVVFPLLPAPDAKEKEAEEAEEHVDPIWQQAKQDVFSPKALRGGRAHGVNEIHNERRVQELQTHLIKSLKHAGNIRNLKPDEWIILTVVGGAQQPGGAVNHRLLEDLDRQLSRNVQPHSAGGGYGGASYSGAGGGYGVGGFGATDFSSATVLTMRAKKADVDAFAKGEMDLDEFRRHVVILTYPHLSGKVTGERRFEADARGRSRAAPAVPSPRR